MIQKFLSKYITEVIPSVVATVLGAYIVTHYVNSKPDADKPAAAVSSPAAAAKAVAEPAKAEAAKAEPPKVESVKTEPAPAKSETPLEAEKSGEKSAQAARVLRHHQIVVKERAAKAAAEKSAPVEASATPEDRRDANDIARAAIERLRGAEPRAAETKTPERKLNTVGYAPAVTPPQTPAVVPSPPYVPQASAPTSIQVAPPPAAYVPPPAREAAIPAQVPVIAPMPPATNVAPLPMPQPPASVARVDDPSRPTPPADIPSRPLDIRAKENTSVAEDVVSAAKNAFEAVLPR